MTTKPPRPAPTSIPGILKELGPGLIVAGAVVGSGELIATTATGAEAGYTLMWLIIIGCVIKVFVQVELGRFVIMTGRTTLQGINSLPGWKPFKTHFIIWYWLIVFMAAVGQMGGIVGGVGQAISIAVPITEEGAAFNEAAGLRVQASLDAVGLKDQPIAEQIVEAPLPPAGPDTFIWAFLVTGFTAFFLYKFRYGAIEFLVTALVALFTLVTLLNLFMLQSNPVWAISGNDILEGLKFRLPSSSGSGPLLTGLATFGIIGVAAGELVFYPYWCLEKGYAAWIGPADGSTEWEERARGWLRVLRWDAFCSLIVYTTSTLIFYLLGAAILNRSGLHPVGMEMIRTLAAMYEPVFGEAAVGLFLFGAIVILYSTFFVTNASKARVFADALIVFGWRKPDKTRDRAWVKGLGLFFPIAGFIVFWLFPFPKKLILLAGAMQSILLPMLGFSALYFRYKYCMDTLRPSRAWDALLWLSAAVMTVAGISIAGIKLLQ